MKKNKNWLMIERCLACKKQMILQQPVPKVIICDVCMELYQIKKEICNSEK